MSENYVVGEKKGNIYYITLNRPEKRNAINFDMVIDISQKVEDVVTDPEIRAIIIKGEGKIFSAGIDFNALGMVMPKFMADSSAGGAAIRADIHKCQQYYNSLESFEIPIICAMHGRVLGMGVELALVGDIRLMSEECLWGMPEVRLGLIADLGGTSRLPRLLGPSRAMEILMTGRLYTARQALEWGLVNYIYPGKEELYAGAEKLAGDIAKMAPIAVGAFKKAIKRGDGVDLMTRLDMEVNLQSVLLRTEDCKEGIQSMIEKREPNWKRK